VENKVNNTMEKPKKKDYGYSETGYHNDSGWCLEGGKEAYHNALEKYNNWVSSGCRKDITFRAIKDKPPFLEKGYVVTIKNIPFWDMPKKQAYMMDTKYVGMLTRISFFNEDYWEIIEERISNE